MQIVFPHLASQTRRVFVCHTGGNPSCGLLFSLGLFDVRDATPHVRWDGDVNKLRSREAKLFHDLHELGLGLGQPRVELLFFANRRHGPALVVVGGEDRARVRKGEQLRVYGVPKPCGVSALKVRAAAPSDEKSVPGEDCGLVVENKRYAPCRVARRRTDDERSLTERDRVPRINVHVRFAAASTGKNRLCANFRVVCLNKARASNVVGMDVGVDHAYEFKLKVRNELDIPLNRLVDGVNKKGLPRCRATEKIGVSR
mmetsp:Transcript_30856/g.69297  ORF Transcript_30856/g.69297 Transcript_30856/m.69297 type:complete len:257 (-) Transcript_30856:220-990(-)